MSLQSNKALAARAIEIWSTGNIKEVDEVYASNCVSHHLDPQTSTGREEWKILIQKFRQAFPDIKEVIEFQVAEGDKVVTHLTFKGTQKGRFDEVGPTNKKVSTHVVVIDRIEDGKIIETWTAWDKYGVLEQLGALALAHHGH